MQRIIQGVSFLRRANKFEQKAYVCFLPHQATIDYVLLLIKGVFVCLSRYVGQTGLFGHEKNLV
jgi:hypothetical protein